MSFGQARPDPVENALARRRYDRIAPVYDLMNLCAELAFRRWREWLWKNAPDRGRIVQVGIGTGRNIPYHPREAQVVGVDLSPRMLARARRRREKLRAQTELILGDAQALRLSDGSVDAAFATFVFCSVPDPVLALKELRRVMKPGARAYFFEHMRATDERIGQVMDALNPLIVRVLGPNINRRTLDNMREAGLVMERALDVGLGGIFKVVVARAPVP